MKTNKIETVMHEYKVGSLKSSSGDKVTNRKQAIAIAMSEQERANKRKRRGSMLDSVEMKA
jgi:hypothetical protein